MGSVEKSVRTASSSIVNAQSTRRRCPQRRPSRPGAVGDAVIHTADMRGGVGVRQSVLKEHGQRRASADAADAACALPVLDDGASYGPFTPPRMCGAMCTSSILKAR